VSWQLRFYDMSKLEFKAFKLLVDIDFEATFTSLLSIDDKDDNEFD